MASGAGGAPSTVINREGMWNSEILTNRIWGPRNEIFTAISGVFLLFATNAIFSDALKHALSKRPLSEISLAATIGLLWASEEKGFERIQARTVEQNSRSVMKVTSKEGNLPAEEIKRNGLTDRGGPPKYPRGGLTPVRVNNEQPPEITRHLLAGRESSDQASRELSAILALHNDVGLNFIQPDTLDLGVEPMEVEEGSVVHTGIPTSPPKEVPRVKDPETATKARVEDPEAEKTTGKAKQKALARSLAAVLSENPELMAAVLKQLPKVNPGPSTSGVSRPPLQSRAKKEGAIPLNPFVRARGRDTPVKPPPKRMIPTPPGPCPKDEATKATTKKSRPEAKEGKKGFRVKTPGQNVPSVAAKPVRLDLSQHGGEGPTGAVGVKIPKRKAPGGERMEQPSPLVDDTPQETKGSGEVPRLPAPARLCWNCRREGHRDRECPEPYRPHCRKCGRPCPGPYCHRCNAEHEALGKWCPQIGQFVPRPILDTLRQQSRHEMRAERQARRYEEERPSPYGKRGERPPMRPKMPPRPTGGQPYVATGERLVVQRQERDERNPFHGRGKPTPQPQDRVERYSEGREWRKRPTKVRRKEEGTSSEQPDDEVEAEETAMGEAKLWAEMEEEDST
ncbi:serine/arginine repetitive matrix protein 1-like [Diachasmimorpha longicaudata]|uniref:serine/arginine repetitive matrix protein 1-like n=1 Tax=Diachasmimorpha longicaudata TaxID=58733 RepID=UPI0030B8FFF8